MWYLGMKQIIIQERIDQVLNEEFKRLLKENQNDILLKLLIDDELDNYSIDDLKEILSEVD
jgi:hypothetical protein